MNKWKWKVIGIIVAILAAGIYYYMAIPAINIHSSGNNTLSLMSRKVKVRVEEKLMRYIQENDSIDIKIN